MVEFDPNTTDARVERAASAWWDVTGMVLPPSCDDCFWISNVEWNPSDGRLDFDVTISNPTAIKAWFPRGVLIFPDDSFHLDDPWGYHDWYFDGIGPELDPVRMLKEWHYKSVGPHKEATNHWTIHLPDGLSDAFEIGFVVEVSWPDQPNEPWKISEVPDETHGALYSGGGGELDYLISVMDEQRDVESVSLDTGPLGMGVIELVQLQSSYASWHSILHNAAGVGPGTYRLLATARDSVSPLEFHQYLDVIVEAEGIPANPQLECVWNLWPNYPPDPSQTFYLDNDILWAVFHNEAWLAFDISDPANPVPLPLPKELVGGLGPYQWGWRWAVGPGYGVWLVEWTPDTGLLRIYDLSVDPIPDVEYPDSIVLGPPELDAKRAGPIMGIFGEIVALSYSAGGNDSYVALLDCSNPSAPVFTDIAGPAHTYYVIQVSEDWLVTMGHREGGGYEARIYSRPVSLDDEPILATETVQSLRDALIKDNVLLLPNIDSTLRRFQYTPGDGWVELSPVTILSPGERLGGGPFTSDRWFCGASDVDTQPGLAILDVSNPLEPSLLELRWDREYRTPLKGEIEGDYLVSAWSDWLASYFPHDGELLIRGIADLDTVLGRIDYDIEGMSEAVDVVGDIVAIAEGSMGLLVADISSLPDAPVVLARVDTAGKAHDIRLFDSPDGLVAYVTSESHGVEVYDLTNPSNPQLTCELSYSGVITIDCDGKWLVAGGSSGIQVWELTDAFHPSQKGVLHPPDGSTDGPAWDVVLQGGALWARTDHCLTRYALDMVWPPSQLTRSGLSSSEGWLDVTWPMVIDPAWEYDYYPRLWLYPLPQWLEHDGYMFMGDTSRVAVSGSYFYRQAGAPGWMGSVWGSVWIYDWHDFISAYPEPCGEILSETWVPGWWFLDGTDFPGGADFIVHENRLFMARGALDLTTVRLW